jgi:hypothetical protein
VGRDVGASVGSDASVGAGVGEGRRVSVGRVGGFVAMEGDVQEETRRRMKAERRMRVVIE